MIAIKVGGCTDLRHYVNITLPFLAHCITFSLEFWRIKWTLTNKKKEATLQWSIKLALKIKSQSKHVQNKFCLALKLHKCRILCMQGQTPHTYCESISAACFAGIGCDESQFRWAIENSFRFNICDLLRKPVCSETREQELWCNG